MEKFLGIVGGLGSLASSHLYDLIIHKTLVKCDQDHIDMVIFNHASIPDRTSFILGKSDQSPLPELKKDVEMLSL